MLGRLEPEETPRQAKALLVIQGLDVERSIELDDVRAKGDKQRLTPQQRMELVSFLYRILDTLDSKTSHVLRVNSTLLAGHSALVGLSLTGEPSGPELLLIALPLLVPIYSVLQALPVFQIALPFFDFVPGESRRPQNASLAEEIVMLGRVCDERQKAHKDVVFWLKVSLAALAFSLISVVVIF
jgi:hypothetical protein